MKRVVIQLDIVAELDIPMVAISSRRYFLENKSPVMNSSISGDFSFLFVFARWCAAMKSLQITIGSIVIGDQPKTIGASCN